MRELIPKPRRYDRPFPYLVDRAALPSEVCAYLRALFDFELDWALHQYFYEAWLAVVTDLVPSTLAQDLIGRVSTLVGEPLLDQLHVTIQRMEPGQFAGVHTDAPLAGYEAVRLVVQLNEDWQPEHGGVLQIHGHEAGETVVRDHSPTYGSGFVFVLHPTSLHAVTQVRKTRRTVVFNFFHVGNPPELEARIQALFDGMHVSKLPSALDALASEAEAVESEDDTYRATCVAWVLHRLGASPEVVCAGYQAGLQSLSPSSSTDSTVCEARWATRMRLEGFDAALWHALGRPEVPEP